MPYLSIILPTYNRLYSLDGIFLPSLESQLYTDYELIVIDDASTDNTSDFFNDIDFPKKYPNIFQRLTYIKNPTNLWAPWSRNKGALVAKGTWIWIVEDDIFFQDEMFLKKFEEISTTVQKNVSVISPKRVESISKGYYNNIPKNFTRIGTFSWEIYLDPSQEYSGYVDNTHCSSFIKKDVYLDIWWQDSILFYGNTFRDESDLYFRIRKNWFKILYVGDVLKIIHRNDFALSWGQKKIINKGILTQEYIVMKNHFLYLRKNYSHPLMRLFVFTIIRWIKHFSNITHLPKIKNLLSLLKI